jgi:hypothetical protein
VKGLRNPVNTRCLQSAIRDVIAYVNRNQNAPTSTALIATAWSISADFKFATNRLFDLIITLILLGTDKTALVCFQSEEHEQMFLDFVEQIRENTALDFSAPPSKSTNFLSSFGNPIRLRSDAAAFLRFRFHFSSV